MAFSNYHLELLGADQARQAIAHPVQRYGIHYEDGLVEEIIRDLGGDTVDPPQLQIVCDRLYAEMELQEAVISQTQYARLGGARAILAVYLDEVLSQYPAAERGKLQAVLKEFVTSDGRRAHPTLHVLAQHTDLALVEVQQVLEELEQARLIREIPPEPYFELVHEYLISQILLWTGEEDRAQRRAQEMLEQGFARWQNFRLPLFADELIIINKQCEKLRFTNEIRSFLIHSSVWTGPGAEHWLEQATAEQRIQTIQAALEDVAIDRRTRASMLAGRFAVAELIPALMKLVEEDSALEARHQAMISLFQLQGTAVVPWLTTLLNGSPRQQQHALEALDEIQRVTDWNLGATQDLVSLRLRLQLRQLRWQQNRRQWQFVTMYAGVGGATGGTMGGAVAALLPHHLSEFVVSTVLGTTFGLLAGAGVGFGYGSVLATREPRRSLLYVLGSALGGSIMGLLGTSADLLPEKMVWSMPIGILSGAATGSAMALLINLSARFSGRTRFALRLILGTMLGVITAGLLLSFGTQVGSVEGGLPVVPLQPVGAVLLGAFTVAGIAGGLELAERRLESSHLLNSMYPSTKEANV